MDLNWARTNLRKKEKKLPSHYYETASLYIGKFYFCTRKHIEVGLNLSFAAGPKMLCLCFYVFFNWPGDSKHLGSARRQADEYIAPGGKFFMFFI
jgi:hypothetical protein